MIGPEIALPEPQSGIYFKPSYSITRTRLGACRYPEPNLRSDRLVAEPHLGPEKNSGSKLEVPKKSDIERGTLLKIYKASKDELIS